MIPAEFTNEMRRLLDAEEYEAFFDTYSTASLHTLRMNPLKKAGTYTEVLHACFPDQTFDAVPWCPEGFYFTPTDRFRPGLSPYHSAGVYYIQEASAMVPAVCLDAQPGELVLDLCAAPGGKSTQIAGAMQGQGLLIANEIVPSRAKILSENIERMGIRNAVVTNESPQRLADAWPEFFDRILVDAPCSGEGMFRKNPEAINEWSEDAVCACAARQDEILSSAARMLRPGGTLVYSTCTFNTKENEGTLTRFLQGHPDFHMAEPPLTEAQMLSFGFSHGMPSQYPGAPQEIRQAIRIFPHRAKGEGHFIAILRRKGTPRQATRCAGTSRPSQTVRARHTRQTAGADEKRPAYAGRSGSDRKRQASANRSGSSENSGPLLLQRFLRDTLLTADSVPGILTGSGPGNDGRMLPFGDQLYLLPPETPPLDGIRVLRPGLHLGTLKKNRFEPSHALALALSAQQVVRSFDLTPEQACDWITGQTISASQDIPAGWTLITVSGYSLGWAKFAAGTLKNHYPKGLRRG